MSARLDALRVLVIDDSRHMINIVKAILRGFGVKDIYEAESAAEAFALLRNTPVDIVMVDMAMQPLDGVDFVKLVRTSPDSENRFVPIIMLTAYSERPKVEAARDAGVTEFCAKPVTAAEIYRKVVAVVNQPRSFVQTGVYFGPDRRRRKNAAPDAGDRRFPPEAPKLPE